MCTYRAQCSRLQSSKVGSTKASHRVPALPSPEAGRVAPRVVAARDVVERAGIRVEERVEEAEGAPAGRSERIVDERDDAREDRASTARAVDPREPAAEDDLDVRADRRDIGVCAARGVEFAAVRRADGGDVGRDGGRLVRRCDEVVGEAAAGEVRRGLAAERRGERGCTNRGQACGLWSASGQTWGGTNCLQGASRGEGRDELGAAGRLRAGDATIA